MPAINQLAFETFNAWCENFEKKIVLFEENDLQFRDVLKYHSDFAMNHQLTSFDAL